MHKIYKFQKSFYSFINTKDEESALKLLDKMKTPNIDFPIQLKSGFIFHCIHLAVQFGMERLLLKMIQKGVDISLQDSKGQNALHYAQMYHREEIANLLVRTCPLLIVSGDTKGVTPFHLAAYINDVSAIQSYLDAKHEMNLDSITDHNGRTPLCYARDLKCNEAFTLLKNNGATVESTTNQDKKCSASIS